MLGFDANGILAGSGRASRPNRFARNPGRKLPGLDQLGHDASASDDRLVADIGHDNAPGADPAILTDDHTAGLSRLVANRYIQAIECMGIWSRGNLNAGTKQGILTDRDQTELAIGTDINVLAKAAIGLRKQGPESDKDRPIALREDTGKKRGPQYYAHRSGNQSDPLACAFDSRVGPENRSNHPIDR